MSPSYKPSYNGVLISFRLSTKPSSDPSDYITELTRYLSNIMDSVLLGLPTEIKELIYFDALSHVATMILVSNRHMKEISGLFCLLAYPVTTTTRISKTHFPLRGSDI